MEKSSSINHDNDITDPNNNTIIFTSSRMNPPTPGHMRLVRRLINEAISKNINDVYIILSISRDKKNPLDCETQKKIILGIMIEELKRRMIEESLSNEERIKKIQEMTVNIECSENNNVLGQLKKIIDEKAAPFSNEGERKRLLINLFGVYGHDRIETLDTIKNLFYDGDYPILKSISGVILKRDSHNASPSPSSSSASSSADASSPISENALSGTIVRNLVNSNNREVFKNIYKPWLNNDDDDSEKLFHDIEQGLVEGKRLEDAKKEQQKQQQKMKREEEKLRVSRLSPEERIQENNAKEQAKLQTKNKKRERPENQEEMINEEEMYRNSSSREEDYAPVYPKGGKKYSKKYRKKCTKKRTKKYRKKRSKKRRLCK
jgi:nicotinic acid mononucleotide adenylyltransferase